MKKILDKMFEKKKLAFWVPIIFAALIYLLFFLFCSADEKNNMLIATPIVTLFWFFGSFLVVFIQVKNPSCSESFLNLIELVATGLFTAFSLVSAISFVAGGFQTFSLFICPGLVTYSSVSWAHSKRTK